MQRPEFVPVARSIGRTHKFLRAWGDRELAPLGASVTDFILLFHIEAEPAPGASQTEIARYSDMGAPALVRHLDRMERDGYIRRRRDQADRRIVRVTVTDAGRERLDRLTEVIRRCDERVRSVLEPAEQDVLQRALDKVFTFATAELERTEPHAIAAPRSTS